MIADVYVAIASYGPDADIPILLAVGATAELAESALERLIDDSEDPEQWIAEGAELHGVAQADAGGEPAWRSRTEEEQNRLAMLMIEEVSDCAKEIAHDRLDGMSSEEIDEYLAEVDEDEAGVI